MNWNCEPERNFSFTVPVHCFSLFHALADFIHKLGVANKEVREALYWLRLAHEAEITASAELVPLIREADELVAILTASIKTAKRRELESRAE